MLTLIIIAVAAGNFALGWLCGRRTVTHQPDTGVISPELRELLAQWCAGFDRTLVEMDRQFGARARIVGCTHSRIDGLPAPLWFVEPDARKE